MPNSAIVAELMNNSFAYANDWKVWIFWKSAAPLDPTHATSSYPGESQDLHYVGLEILQDTDPERPFADIIRRHRCAAALGLFPENFHLFVKTITASESTTNQII